ncbi:hypothetical protein DCAR_0519447 [Daucus carota subsp. sativus]|uniref:Putative plant transposon protein domain-containing protein n=1 Tax=Daucus carota subsp. sativus TaxID=79200 RepID=A0AAF0X5E3_DAUCS|nr:PREDICTED: uncharacterized protein LOC108224139 [Daucus carota subsp. sativus]WOH00091.1 hypothetical protein DCAR_0519447 [Daucus carota subsp. sativus]
MSKSLLRERLVDSDLFSRIGLSQMFEDINSSALLDPLKVFYPALVREFCSNFKQLTDTMYSTTVKGVPMPLKSDLVGLIFGLSGKGVCPFTTHQPFVEDDLLPFTAQVELIVSPHFAISDSARTPISLLLFKFIHTNILPHKSGRDRVTFQDIALLSLLNSHRPFNMSLLILKHMHHCVSHDSMHFPYPALLTKIFQYFEIISVSDESVALADMFDSRVLAVNHLSVSNDDVLVFDLPSKFASDAGPSHTKPSPLPSNVYDLLGSLLAKVEANSQALASLNSKIDAFGNSVTLSAASIDDKLLYLKTLVQKFGKHVDFEFGSL